MALKNISAGSVIFEAGQNIDKLLFIMKGSVKVIYEGGDFRLQNQDIVGLIGLGSRQSYARYEAVDNVSVVEYPINKGVESLIEENKDIRKYIMTSLFRQLKLAIEQYRIFKTDYEALGNYIRSAYDNYREICELSQMNPQGLSDFNNDFSAIFEGSIPVWFDGYYSVLAQVARDSDYGAMDVQFITGLLHNTAKDISKLMFAGQEMEEEKLNLLNCLVNEDGTDLIEMYLSLYIMNARKNGKENEQAQNAYSILNSIMDRCRTIRGIDTDALEQKKRFVEDELRKFDESSQAIDEVAKEYGKDSVQDIVNSLDTILAYSEVDPEFAEFFKDTLHSLFELMKGSSDNDNIRKLRLAVTKGFNKIYTEVFLKAVEADSIPTVIKMFLNFGYMDENLVGMDNALELQKISETDYSDPDYGVYSIFEWLKSIYNCEKDPGRNEFEVDYAEYLHEQARNGEIEKKDEEILFKDSRARVLYELENIFPVVNKISSGRIINFCPVLSEQDMVKTFDSMLVNWKKVTGIIKEVRSIDYGAFYRETMYSAPQSGVDREIIDVEILPNVILTPNIGSKGIMWQEIEGKRRTTAARFFISVFQQEDLKNQLIRLIGQFRWELCKRIQGAHWNEPGEHSLTSEYFDYVQYYRKNNDLSQEAKEKIKNDLVRCKNSFREMFMKDYTLWILYESQGSPRLNKVARNILFTYVPFAKDRRDSLKINPMYREIIERYEVKQGSKVHRINNLIKKLTNNGKEVPDEIMMQQRFLNS